MTPLPFTDRDSYLNWRAQWRTDYATLTLRIKELKAQRKDADSAIRSVAQYQAWACRKRAFQMLLDRAQSKVQAQQQYTAAHASQAA